MIKPWRESSSTRTFTIFIWFFNTNEGLPEHFSNSNVYMTVVRGRLSISLNDQSYHVYEAGTLLKIPFQTEMNVKNLHPETLELIVVKAPAPKS